MGKLLLPASTNYIDAATLSGGSWSLDDPLTEILNRDLSRAAISTNAANASTKLRVDFGAAKDVSLIGVIGTNSPRESNPDTCVAKLYDADPVSNPPIWTSSTPAMSDLAPRRTWSTHWFGLPPRVSARWLDLEFDCTTIPDTFLQIARLVVCDVIDLPYNFSYGASAGIQANSEIVEGAGGVEQSNDITDCLTFRASLENLNATTAFGSIRRLLGRVSTTGEVLAIIDPDETTALKYDQPIYGRFRSLSDIEYPVFERYSVGIEIKGSL